MENIYFGSLSTFWRPTGQYKVNININFPIFISFMKYFFCVMLELIDSTEMWKVLTGFLSTLNFNEATVFEDKFHKYHLLNWKINIITLTLFRHDDFVQEWIYIF